MTVGYLELIRRPLTFRNLRLFGPSDDSRFGKNWLSLDKQQIDEVHTRSRPSAVDRDPEKNHKFVRPLTDMRWHS